MRMWMVNPKIMCKQHLIGEYRELFTFMGAVREKKSISGYIKNNLLEPLSVKNRYEVLKSEMINRNYKPKKEFIVQDMNYISKKELNNKVNVHKSLNDLLNRCPECKKRFVSGFLSQR